jgi:TolB protein
MAKNMKKITIFIFFLSFLWGEEEMEVSLSTSKPLCPVYFSLTPKESKFNNVYLDKIRKILEYDIENSGLTTLISRESGKEKLLSHPDLKVCFNLEFWKKQKARFILKMVVTGDKLDTYFFDPLFKGYKNLSKIQLMGDLFRDRRIIHKFFDDFLLISLGKRGIAETTILYTVRRDNPDKRGIPWLSEVWVCDYDGENRRQLTFENSYCVSPVYLPSSDSNLSFLYVSYKRGIPKIFIHSQEKKDLLFTLRGNQLLPSISPKEDCVAFISDAAGAPDLFIQRLDQAKNPIGMPRQIYSAPRGTQATSSFSPDGEKLAFVSDKDGSPRIYILKIPENDGNEIRPYAHLITKKNRENVTPAWSPDGNMLAYSSNINGIRQICIYDFALNEESQITFGGENKENPCWAEDNLHIVYNTEYKATSELYVINLNNPNPVKISTGQGQKRFPAWGTLRKQK